jgi:hypothetical protein
MGLGTGGQRTEDRGRRTEEGGQRKEDRSDKVNSLNLFVFLLKNKFFLGFRTLILPAKLDF